LHGKLTESRRIFEVLKSLYITGLSEPWRKAKPLAAPSAMLILVDHERGSVVSEQMHYQRLSDDVTKYSNLCRYTIPNYKKVRKHRFIYFERGGFPGFRVTYTHTLKVVAHPRMHTP
jgi:hypothetical protein